MCDTYSSTYTHVLLKMVLFTPLGKCASIFVGMAGLVPNVNSQTLGAGATSFQIETRTGLCNKIDCGPGVARLISCPHSCKRKGFLRIFSALQKITRVKIST